MKKENVNSIWMRKNKQNDRQRDKETVRQKNKQTDRQKDGQIES